MRTYMFLGVALAVLTIPAAARAEVKPYAGLSFGAAESTLSGPDDDVRFPGSVSDVGFVPGFIAGITLQNGSRLVLGIEVAGNHSLNEAKGVDRAVGYIAPLAGATIDARRSYKSNWDGSVSAKVGVDLGRVVVAGTFGYKAANITHRLEYQASNQQDPFFMDKSRSTAHGPVVGVEVIFDLNDWMDVGVRAERSELRLSDPAISTGKQKFNTNAISTRAIFKF